MKLPTGIVDFASICKENYFYLDKTKVHRIIGINGEIFIFY